MEACNENESLNFFVKGFMVESYLIDGQQLPGGGVFGKSVTDPCLGWDKTKAMIYNLADRINM